MVRCKRSSKSAKLLRLWDCRYSLLGWAGRLVSHRALGNIVRLADVFSLVVLSPLSEFYGRRPVYNLGFALFFITNFLVAFSNNITAFLIGRFLSGAAGSAFLSVAGGSVSVSSRRCVVFVLALRRPDHGYDRLQTCSRRTKWVRRCPSTPRVRLLDLRWDRSSR